MTHTLVPANSRAHYNCSIRRASGFVQTPFSSRTISSDKLPSQDIELLQQNSPIGSSRVIVGPGPQSSGRCVGVNEDA